MKLLLLITTALLLTVFGVTLSDQAQLRQKVKALEGNAAAVAHVQQYQTRLLSGNQVAFSNVYLDITQLALQQKSTVHLIHHFNDQLIPGITAMQAIQAMLERMNTQPPPLVLTMEDPQSEPPRMPAPARRQSVTH